MIDEPKMRRLKEIAQNLAELDDSLVTGGRSEHFIETRTGADGTFEVYANAEGFVHLARQMMRIAKDRIDGNHVHFDAASMLEQSDRPFLISYKSADWDKETTAR